jgi:transposase
MSKQFRPWKIDQPQFLPPSVQDFVAPDHMSRFIVGLVRDSLDLKDITGTYTSALGQPPFDPRMLVALLLHAYASGIYSSRRIAKATEERADFMMIVALDPPDFRTISDFRKRHLTALSQLFVQVLRLCEKAGLVKLGHVALDGTKIKANASKHKAMSYERMAKREAELKAEVAKWLAAAEAADAAEDTTHGRAKRGDEMPKWVADKQQRIKKIAEAKAALEAEAKSAAEEERRIEAEKEAQREAEGRKKPGKPGKPPSDEPDPKTQRNFTDPESRILKTKDGYIQGYNAQAAVDATAQIIVAHDLTPSTSDQGQLAGMVDAIEANMGRKPDEFSADAGYCSEANLAALNEREINGYVATGRAKHPADDNGKTGGPLTQLMRKKIADGGHETPYRLRKQTVEPVFGQIKQARGFRQFLLRGLANVRAEWALICIAHNLTKLAKAAKAVRNVLMPMQLHAPGAIWTGS